jgi:hypothetical protein
LLSPDHRPTEAVWQREEPVEEAKLFNTPKREAWEAHKRVKATRKRLG